MKSDGFSDELAAGKVEKTEWEIVEPDETVKRASRERSSAPRTLLHPLAALAMVVLDFGGFAGDIGGLTVLFLLPLVIGLIFLVATFLVTWIQNKLAGEELEMALVKGLIAGILCAIPTPIFGTAVGGFILLKSGLGEFQKGGLRRLMGMFAARKNS